MGRLTFLKDDPGRQTIGSFHPLTDDDWTEMAYVGNTQRLCQDIVDGNVGAVREWLAQEGANVNQRDFTGRTPLHLAVMCSTPEVVKMLVEAGARLVARLADGRTALHLAVQRGDVEIVKILLDQSAKNEAEWEEKQEKAKKVWDGDGDEEMKDDKKEEDEDEPDGSDEEDEDMSVLSSNDADEDGMAHSTTTGSFVKLRNKQKKKDEKPSDDITALDNATEDEPDFYDINVTAWDTPCSALHLAIIEGHFDVVKLLVQEYGADVLMPVKRFSSGSKKPSSVLLTLVLALALPSDKAAEMTRTLLSLGATSAQADLRGMTALHRFVDEDARAVLDALLQADPAGAKMAINHLAKIDRARLRTPLCVAIMLGCRETAKLLLEHGAQAQIPYEAWYVYEMLNLEFPRGRD